MNSSLAAGSTSTSTNCSRDTNKARGMRLVQRHCLLNTWRCAITARARPAAAAAASVQGTQGALSCLTGLASALVMIVVTNLMLMLMMVVMLLLMMTTTMMMLLMLTC